MAGGAISFAEPLDRGVIIAQIHLRSPFRHTCGLRVLPTVEQFFHVSALAVRSAQTLTTSVVVMRLRHEHASAPKRAIGNDYR
jgi:hypothetical protein